MKKGLSPVIATTLLIAIVVVLAAIIFLWARGFISERAEKFGRAVDLSCADVNFEAGVFENELDIVNRGNVPLYGFDIKIIRDGEIDSEELLLEDISGTTLGLGASRSISIESLEINSGDQLNVVPIILGETDSGKVAHTCGDEFGYVVDV